MRGLVLVSTLLLAHCFYEVPPLADVGDGASADSETSTNDSGLACTCVPPIPQGWTPVVFDGDMQPACPTGWGSPMDWITNPTAPASTCTCACGSPSAQPSCDAAANFTVQFGTTNQCNGPMGTVSAAQMCTSDNTTFPSNQPLTFVKATPVNLAPTGGACAAGTASQTIPPATFSKGRSCSLQTKLGTCMAGDACVPTAPPPFQTCISKDGNNACPNGFTKKTLGGTAVLDTRACGPNACSCSITGSCDPPSLHLYTIGFCNVNNLVANISADGTCYSTAMNIAGFTILSARYNNTFAVNVACADPSYAPTGALSVSSPTTFCCL